MDVFIVKVEYSSAVFVPKIERAITKHAEIVSQTYLNAPDKNGYWTPCTSNKGYNKNPSPNLLIKLLP